MENTWYASGEKPAGLTEAQILNVESDQSATYSVSADIEFIHICLDLDRVVSGDRDGNDLVIKLTNGEIIRLKGYFLQAGDLPPIDFDDCAGFPLAALLSGLGLAALAAGGVSSGGGGADPIPAPTVEVGEENSNGTVTVTGIAGVRSTVTVAFPSGETVVVVADDEGNYTATSTEAQPDGTVTATQVLEGGTESSGPGVDEFVDGPLLPPTIETVLPAGEGAVTVIGMASPNAEVTVTFPTGETVIVTADGAGEYTATSTTAQPIDGTVIATQVEKGGTESSEIAEGSYQDEVPPVVDISSIDSTAIDGDVVVSGTSDEPNAPVVVTLADGTSIATTTDGNGDYSVTFEGPVGDQAVTVVVTDDSGNEGTTAGVIDDTTPPVISIDAVDSTATDGTVEITGSST
ncbi:Ig-like domain-containing protein, partial [Sulfitobacter sp.]|uniref:Ig-like domain-containing protein n=1 Tax=Sulfitobacter sp. TaxID=1903071 RepID=UPI003EF1D1FF